MAMKSVTKNVKVKGVVIGTVTIQKPTNAEEWKEIHAKTALSGKTAAGAPVTTTVDAWDAWYYGAILKVMAAVRNAATEGVVDNHKIAAGGKSTDLDTLPVAKGVAVVNALRTASAAGLGAGDKNMAKVEHYAKGLIEKGEAHEANGVLVAGPAKGNGAAKK